MESRSSGFSGFKWFGAGVCLGIFKGLRVQEFRSSGL